MIAHGPDSSVQVLVAPGLQREEEGQQPDPLPGGSILLADPLARSLIRHLAHDAELHQAGEAVGEHAPGDPEVGLDVVEATNAEEHLAKHQDRPLVAERIEVPTMLQRFGSKGRRGTAASDIGAILDEFV